MKRLSLTGILICAAGILAGCATVLGPEKLNTPPEFNQKILLHVPEDYQAFQATRSTYDVGDLQSFHSQHVFPVLVEDAFKQMFGQVEMLSTGSQVEMQRPDVPAIFEVRMIDMAHDIHSEADSYRSQVVLAVAMRSPRDRIFWQKSFRGEGYVLVNDQFSTGLGPQDAVIDAVNHALDQMQQAILAAPEVRTQLKYYRSIERARGETEAGL